MKLLHQMSGPIFVAALLGGCEPKEGAIPALQNAEVYSQNRCNGPSAQWRPADGLDGDMESKNLVKIRRSAILWNEARISQEEFQHRAAALAAFNPTPPTTELLLYDDVDCATVRMARTALEKSVKCAISCREYSQSDWAKMNTRIPPPPKYPTSSVTE